MKRFQINRRWTETDVERLVDLRRRKKTVENIAFRLRRTAGSVTHKLKQLNLINGNTEIIVPDTPPKFAKAELYLRRRGYVVHVSEGNFIVDGNRISGTALNAKAARVRANTELLAA